MEKTIKISGLDVKYDIDALVAQAELLEWSEEEYESSFEQLAGDGWVLNEEEFKKAKADFIDGIKKMDNIFESLFLRSVHITKAGKLAKNRNHVLIESSIVENYHDYYGSHQYTIPAIVAYENIDGTVGIQCTSVNRQESF